MKQRDFPGKDEIRTPDQETDVRFVLAENAALKEEVSELKARLAWLEKQVYGQKSEKSEIVPEVGEQLTLFNEAEAGLIQSGFFISVDTALFCGYGVTVKPNGA